MISRPPLYSKNRDAGNTNKLLLFVTLFLLPVVVHSRVIYIEDYGGLPDSDSGLPKDFVYHPEFVRSLSTSSSTTSNVVLPKKKQPQHRVSFQSTKDDHNDKLVALGQKNTEAFNQALTEAKEGDTIKLKENQSYTFIGGIRGQDLKGVIIDFAGYTRFVHDLNAWPRVANEYSFDPHPGDRFAAAISINDSVNVTLTSSALNRAIVDVDYSTNEIYIDSESGSGGIIDGHGKKWWNDAIVGLISVESRPRLCHIVSSMNVVIEKITFVNSPYWTLTVESIGAEIAHVNVMIDRNYQRQLKNNTMTLLNDVMEDVRLDSGVQSFISQEITRKRNLRQGLQNRVDKVDDGENEDESSIVAAVEHLNRLRLGKFHFPNIVPSWILQPENLNTDGIDPIGTDFYIHDCIVLNDDDSIAVKPNGLGLHAKVLHDTVPYTCTRNITITDVVLTGFGASVGSVGPTNYHLCVDDVTFRHVKMPATGKGIYIKSNHADCNGNESSRITNIRYEDIHIIEPLWWPVWIGPQAQHEPHQGLDGACPLNYPLQNSICPTQGCATFENITLKDVLIDNPLISPGVILGNASNPMKNVIFENVTMKIPFKNMFYHGRLPFHESHFPYAGKYQCEHVIGTCKDCQPVPECLTVID